MRLLTPALALLLASAPSRKHVTAAHPEATAPSPVAATSPPAAGAKEAPLPAPPPGPGDIHLIAPPADGEWRQPSGDFAATRYSPLDQITTTNAQQLKEVTTLSTGVPHGHEGQPLVVGSYMYVVTPFPNILLAIDLGKPGGALAWSFDPHADPRAVGIACCDVVNRGACYADGRVVYNTLDGRTIAVDAVTGEKLWDATVGDISVGETLTGAPLIADGRVLVGDSGAELGVRGKLVALDLGTGRELWRAYGTGPDADVGIGPSFKPFYAKDRGPDLGVSTWPRDQWKLGGATAWGWLSFDPQSHVVYYGTANPGAWNPDLRPGDNKWSCSVFARDVATGDARWAFQIVPHDAWDYDEIMENVLVDMPFGGRPRHLLIHPGRTGFVFVFDRDTGELLSAEPFQPVNWASGYDLATGLPRETPGKRSHEGVVTRDICPSSTGGKEFVPSAFSPRTGLLYIPAHDTCMDYEGVEANYIAGTPYLGASVKMFPGHSGHQGELVAWDVAAARKAWGIPEPDFPVYSGVLVTGGDVVFYGTMDGWFKAADARTGTVLWKFPCGSGIVGNPMTYVGPDGKQYVAIYSGIGGWMGAVAFPSISTDDPYAALGVVGAMKEIKRVTGPGDVLHVFAL